MVELKAGVPFLASSGKTKRGSVFLNKALAKKLAQPEPYLDNGGKLPFNKLKPDKEMGKMPLG